MRQSLTFSIIVFNLHKYVYDKWANNALSLHLMFLYTLEDESSKHSICYDFFSFESNQKYWKTTFAVCWLMIYLALYQNNRTLPSLEVFVSRLSNGCLGYLDIYFIVTDTDMLVPIFILRKNCLR